MCTRLIVSLRILTCVGAACAVLCVSSAALSAPADNLGPTPLPKPALGGSYEGGGRVGGDTVADATPIPGLPFTDTGNTCGFADDYDEICPYSGSTAPEVVYSYAPPQDVVVTVNLCDSAYDTKVYIWEDQPGNLVACNDDAGCGYSGWQSKIDSAPLTAGHTYYLVIDGYGSSCGAYSLGVNAWVPCTVECPPGGQPEGEPPCVENYVDHYNGGCNEGFSTVIPEEDGCGTVCGRSCTYLYQGSSYRDTDWYTVTSSGGTMTATCTGEFPLQLILIYGPICWNIQYIVTQAAPCETASLSWSFGPGDEAWVWVGPSQFSGVPESDYVLEVCGITGSVYGACCENLGCVMGSPATCSQHGGTFLGDGTDCDPNPCTSDPPGACCLPDGSCEIMTADGCAADGGQWLGAGTDCDPNLCIPPVPVENTTWGRIKHGFK